MVNAQYTVLSMRSGHFIVKLVEYFEELENALRLRFEVFNRELNEGLDSSYLTGMDRDSYDDYCDHLVVIDTRCNKIVGTYRLLLGSVAENNIGYYSEGEFEMTAIRSLSSEKLELGRSCVHKNYRNAGVINLLWAGIARYTEINDVRHLFGCGSLHTDDPVEVSMVYSYMNMFHRAGAEFNVHPMKKLQSVLLSRIVDRKTVFDKLPPLIKGYLRLGALICGEPAYDDIFGTTDLFLLLETGKLISRYKRRFFQETDETLCRAS
ncbi:MAG: GNAT family N-acetyltransferase [Nitrospirae bacterium]|nr:GNAT family N-acetyltransferase [Nitrospirota bacterium]